MRSNGLPGKGIVSGAVTAACIALATGCGEGLGGWFGNADNEASTFPPGAISGVASYHGSKAVGETHTLIVRWTVYDLDWKYVNGEFTVDVSYSELDGGYLYTVWAVPLGRCEQIEAWWDLDDDGVRDGGTEPTYNRLWTIGPFVRPEEVVRVDFELVD